MSFGIPVRNGLSISLLSTTALSTGRGLVPALGLNFLSGALDPRITFSRGSNATLTDSTGRITYAPTNFVTNSDGPQSSTGTTVSSGVAVAPNGTTTARRIAKTDATTPRYAAWSAPFTAQSNTSYVASAYFKYDGYDTQVSLEYNNAAQWGAVSWVAPFNVTASGVTAVAPSSCTSGVQAVGNGWFRVWAAFTTGTVSTAVTTILTRVTGASGVTVLAWGGQIEAVTYQTTPGTYNSTTPKNLLGYTQEFDNAAWTKTNATVTANAVYAPDGTLTADKLVPNTTSIAHAAQQSATTSAPVTVSIYAKAAGYDRVVFSSNNNNYVYFNLTSGVVESTLGTGWSSAGITSVGNGWYRCSATTSVAQNRFDFLAYNALQASGNSAPTFAGDGTSGIYVWGAQLSDSASLDPYVYNPAAAAASTAYYGPRFDYDPVTLAAKGLLIEEQRTNVTTYSEQFDVGAGWTAGGVTVSANSTFSPAGTQSADTITPDTGNTVHRVYSFSSVATTTASFSCFVKANGYTKVGLRESFTAGPGAAFDLSTGTVIGAYNAGGSTVSNMSIVAVGSGWYRISCAVSFAASTTMSLGVHVLSPSYVAGSDLQTAWVGNGTSGIYIYGAQLEAGSFATSYIPTVASQVTRSADVATMIGDNFKSWYNLNAGTFVVEADTAIITGDRGIISANDGSGNNDIDLRASSSPTAVVASGGASQAILTVSGAVVGTPTKLALAYALNDFAAVRNGGTVAADTSGTTPAVNQMQIGNLIGSTLYNLNGHIRSLGYYNTRQPNATLQTLTNPSTTPSLALNFISDTYTVGA